jgi:hypothetical protein
MKEFKLLSVRTGLFSTKIREALTHYSFYENAENKGNSRYVFAGMYAFKGKVAEILYKYFSGSGTHLQHTLGNLFQNENLHKLFDELELMKLVRADNKFDVKKHKHIFVYGLLGCLYMEGDDVKIELFIRKFFFKDNIIFQKHKTKNKNYWGQLNDFTKQMFDKPALITVEKKGELFYSKIRIKDGETIAEASSKSYRYSRKKAMKLAMKAIVEKPIQEFENNPDYIKRKELVKQQQAEARKIEIAEKIKAKELKAKERARLLKEKAAAKEAARKTAKAEAKKRKQRIAEMLAWKAAKQSQMSSKKRRFLDDKKK